MTANYISAARIYFKPKQF